MLQATMGTGRSAAVAGRILVVVIWGYGWWVKNHPEAFLMMVSYEYWTKVTKVSSWLVNQSPTNHYKNHH